jgi:hypothetical protein
MPDEFFNAETESESIIAGAMRLATLISGYLRNARENGTRAPVPHDLPTDREAILAEAFGDPDLPFAGDDETARRLRRP